MELMYKYVLVIGLIVVALAIGIMFFIGKKRRDVFKEGIKAANTAKIRGTSRYKKLSTIYLSLRIVMVVALIGSILASIVLVSRPYKTEENTTEVKKRDIIICLDVSTSLYELNAEITEYLKNLVAGLEGDRIAISIFNTSTVTYVPLTEDYDYVQEMLDELGEYFALQKTFCEDYVYNPDFNQFSMSAEEEEKYNELYAKLEYFEAGTIYNYMFRGSSLTGEGLATALYSFPYIEEADRTRVIIMVTDNEVNEIKKQIVDLQGAADLCAKNKVTVFGIFPSEEKFFEPQEYSYSSCLNDFKKAVEKTGGKFYVRTADNSVADIVQNIQSQEALLVKVAVSTEAKDLPEIPFIVLFICLVIGCGAGLVLQK